MSDTRTQLERLPCPICSRTEYSWGEVTAQSLYYRGDDSSLLTRMFGTFGGALVARRCNGCGNVQLFSNDPDQPAEATGS